MKPLVSIAMGVYNSSETLKDAIDSMINQTYDNWEFIICDDGSTNETYSYLREFSKKLGYRNIYHYFYANKLI